MKRELTPNQRRALAYLQAAEIPPTMREMAIYLGFSPTSQNAVAEIYDALERKGYIRRPQGTNRARCPVTILRPLPGVLSPRNKLVLIRMILERGDADALQAIRALVWQGEAPSC